MCPHPAVTNASQLNHLEARRGPPGVSCGTQCGGPCQFVGSPSSIARVRLKQPQVILDTNYLAPLGLEWMVRLLLLSSYNNYIQACTYKMSFAAILKSSFAVIGRTNAYFGLAGRNLVVHVT